MNSRLLATKLHLPAIPPKQMQRPQLIQRLNGGLAGLKMYGMASPSKHAILAEYGATPIDYRTKDFAEVIHRADPPAWTWCWTA